MAPRVLDPEMIVHLCDVVERRFFEMFSWFEASLVDQDKEVIAWFETSSVDQDKDRMRKAFCRCLWS